MTSFEPLAMLRFLPNRNLPASEDLTTVENIYILLIWFTVNRFAS